MKFTILLCLAVVACATQKVPSYVPNEFLLRINEQHVTTAAMRAELVQYLEVHFHYELLNTITVGHLQFLKLGGSDVHMEAVSKIPGVMYIERNTLATLFQTCEEQGAAGVWGLDRVDQREALLVREPDNPAATYIHGEDTGTNVTAYVIDTGKLKGEWEEGEVDVGEGKRVEKRKEMG